MSTPTRLSFLLVAAFFGYLVGHGLDYRFFSGSQTGISTIGAATALALCFVVLFVLNAAENGGEYDKSLDQK